MWRLTRRFTVTMEKHFYRQRRNHQYELHVCGQYANQNWKPGVDCVQRTDLYILSPGAAAGTSCAGLEREEHDLVQDLCPPGGNQGQRVDLSRKHPIAGRDHRGKQRHWRGERGESNHSGKLYRRRKSMQNHTLFPGG